MNFSPKLSARILLFLLIGVTSCQKKLDTLTNIELNEKLSAPESFQQLLRYVESVGINPSKKEQADAFKLIEEAVFGNKPNLRHLENSYKPDSAWLRAAAIKLISGKSVRDAFPSLEPAFPAYQQLVTHYQRLVQENKIDSAQQVAITLNTYRWIWRQTRSADRFVLVNIYGAYLKGIDSSGREVIQMRTIVGRAATPTPTMDTYATHIITHPYWHVPKSIATKEMLPKIQRNVEYLAANGIEVIDQKGEVVAADEIDWNSLSPANMPYRFRQDSGEENSLGLLKVEIKNPLAIYLHDTNMRYLFKKEDRWRSHGCVRVEHPTELANFMAGKILLNDDFLTEPTDSLPPKWHKLDTKIPVFLVNLPADLGANGELVYFKNPY
jgi:hypothetical protein